MSLGVVVGRFQVDELTEGHASIINHALAVTDRVLVAIGLVPSPVTATNPLPFESIKHMIQGISPQITVVPLYDCPSDTEWSIRLDTVINSVKLMGEDVILYCGRDGFNKWYDGKYTVTELAPIHEVSGTDIRNDIGHVVLDNIEWRQGVIWAMQNLPTRTYHTVDAALLRYNTNGSLEVLMGRKPHEDLVRFPGGFVDPNETFTKAAGRELMEETGLASLSGMQIVQDFVIDDWRTRNKKGVTHKTVLCVGWHSHGQPKASDDLAEVGWTEVEYALADVSMVVAPHRELMMALGIYLTDSKIPLYNSMYDTKK